MIHFDINCLTALAVFLHLGTSLARTVLRDTMDQRKIDRIDAGVNQVLGTVAAVAAVVGPAPAASSSPLAEALTTALAASGLTLAPTPPAPIAPNAGGAGGGSTLNGGVPHAGA